MSVKTNVTVPLGSAAMRASVGRPGRAGGRMRTPEPGVPDVERFLSAPSEGAVHNNGRKERTRDHDCDRAGQYRRRSASRPPTYCASCGICPTSSRPRGSFSSSSSASRNTPSSSTSRCAVHSQPSRARPGSTLRRRPPSTSGLGHHPFKVAARVRIPLGAWYVYAASLRRALPKPRGDTPERTTRVSQRALRRGRTPPGRQRARR